MINWIKQLIGGQKIALTAVIEHVELSADHLVIGLQLAWENRTGTAISVKDIQLRVLLPGRGQEPLRLYPLERFERVAGQRALHKKPIRPFTLAPGEPYLEQIRFISQEVLDIAPGKYEAEIEIKDIGDIGYTNSFTLRVRPELRYRRSEEWEHD